MSHMEHIKLSEIFMDFYVADAIIKRPIYELVQSIRMHGLNSPPAVRKMKKMPSDESPIVKYEVMRGFSRIMALRIIHFHSPDRAIHCIVLGDGEAPPTQSSTGK